MYTAVLRSVCSYKFLEISLFRKKSNAFNRQRRTPSKNLAELSRYIKFEPDNTKMVCPGCGEKCFRCFSSFKKNFNIYVVL
ncbi:MAG: hypothetical protein LBJ16_04300 [Holosporaceae bacterium]|nr:hypothetical protein [Holosporaceae bacterium]